MATYRKDQKEEFPILEWPIPQIGTSPITGVTGTLFWGAINKPDARSRWVIGDSDLDDAPNFFPQGVQLQLLPSNGPTISTLPSTAIWQSPQVLRGNLYNYFLCQNGHIYQVSTSGTQTDLYTAGSFSQNGTLNSTTLVTGLTSTSQMFVGMLVSGTDIQAGTTIASVDSGTQIHLSLAATGNGTFSLTFNVPLFSSNCDISNWQGGTYVLIQDPLAQVLYSWDGTTLKFALSNQPGNFITTYGDRVWLFTGTSITWTQGGTFNSLSGDAGSTSIGDAGANSAVLGAISDLGVIIVFGANWIGDISNLVVSGSPAVLTFQFVILSSKVGIFSKFSIIAYSNSFYFANNYGFWQLQGSNPVKISPQLDGFFSNIDFTKSSFGCGYITLFNTQCLIWQAYYKGDSNVAAGYTVFGCTLLNNVPNQWWRFSQGTIALIGSLPAGAASGNLPTAWACDGTNVFQLFIGTSSYTGQIDFKIWDFNSKVDYQSYDYFFVSTIITGATTLVLTPVYESGQSNPADGGPFTKIYGAPSSGQWINKFGVVGNWINNSSVQGGWTGTVVAQYIPVFFGLRGSSRALGFNLSITGVGVIVQALVVGYRRTPASRGP